ncbi:uncharacterized protein SCHCODRAFT_02517651, partial [Schizophyllum commune H4-8]|uniref:uncharacterized protein n=1 Tax=Schizophyllum commune (strain H4-8 / FGSC 9210) TaxID=578458 RepID=UPI00215F6C74
AYVDTNLVSTGKIARAAILGLQGGVWAKSAGYEVSWGFGVGVYYITFYAGGVIIFFGGLGWGLRGFWCPLAGAGGEGGGGSVWGRGGGGW